MKHLFSVAALALAVSAAHAAPVYHPAGSNLTLGDTTNSQSIIADITNPAASAVAVANEGSIFRIGILSNIGVGVEYGQVDDIFTIIDEKASAYQDGFTLTLPSTLPTSPAEVPAYVDALKLAAQQPVDDLNEVLGVVADKGYAKVFASMNLPLMPVVVGGDFLGGGLVFDANGSVSTKAVELFAPAQLNYDNVQADLLAGNTRIDLGDAVLDLSDPAAPVLTVENDTLLLTQAAGVGEVGLGYSRQVVKRDKGGLFAGVKLKYYTVGMTRKAFRLADITDAEKLLEDIRDAEFSYARNFGVDLGMVWVGEHYRLGATATNLNEPDFTFAGLDTSGFSDPQGAIAQFLAKDYVYTMTRQYKLEAALYSSSRNWALNFGYDANAAPDPWGDDYQWASASAAYLTDSWWIPGIRAGYRSNLAGEKMDYVTVGLTLFKILNVDAGMSLDSITIDGTEVPRGAMLNAGLALAF